MNNLQYIAIIVFIILFFGCKNTAREITSTKEKMAQGAIYDYEINFPNEEKVMFYMAHIKSPSKHSYSEADLELLSFQSLSELGTEDVRSVRIIEKNLRYKSYQLFVNDELLTSIDLNQINSLAFPNKSQHCSFVTNSLLDLGYRPEDADDNEVWHLYEIGFVPFSNFVKVSTEEEKDEEQKYFEFDWEATFNQSRVLYYMYKDRSSCKDHPFSPKFKTDGFYD